MRYKTIPQDFIVREIFDMESLREKPEEGKGQKFYYFLLTKTNYTQLRALKVVSKVFGTSLKNIHFAGTKDKFAVTTQIISITRNNPRNLQKNVDYLNTFKDISIKYLGEFFCRINLADNIGNSFKVTLRDCSLEEIELVKSNLNTLERIGVLNFFDNQRFGFSNNSHIVGKYILQNKIDLAVKEILTSVPQNFNEEHKKFGNFVLENWDEISLQNSEVIEQMISLAPKFLTREKVMLQHLKKFKNDFAGSFRTLPKKLRTLYVNSYQSHIFNLLLKHFGREFNLFPLISSNTNFEDYGEDLENFVVDFLREDGLDLESFKLDFMPEISPCGSFREVLSFPKNFRVCEVLDDELFENKKMVVVEFELKKGEYATNVIKALSKVGL